MLNRRGRRPAWWTMTLVGVVGIAAPGVVLAVRAFGSYSDIGYSLYVFALVVVVHAVVWFVAAALAWQRLRRRFVGVFAVGVWLALGAAVFAVREMDHPYVYVATYAVTALVVTSIASAFVRDPAAAARRRRSATNITDTTTASAATRSPQRPE